jgi:hypothetical protein
MEDMDFKYTEDGQQVIVLEKISETVTRIEPVYDRGDDEPYFGDSRLWDKPLFDSPPIPRLHELAEKMEQQITKQQEQKKILDSEVQALRSQKELLGKEFSAIPGLQNIVDFLKNPPTHFVLQKYGPPYIVPIEECKVDYSHLANIGIKTGYGLSEPKVRWWIKVKRANSYDYDDQIDGIPCNGLEDAKAKLRVELQKWAASSSARYSIPVINMLRENGIEVPESIITSNIESLNAEFEKIGLDVDAQKAKKRGEIDEWRALLDGSSIPSKEG